MLGRAFYGNTYTTVLSGLVPLHRSLHTHMETSLVPRPSHCPAFNRLQYTGSDQKLDGEKSYCMQAVIKWTVHGKTWERIVPPTGSVFLKQRV